MQFRYLPILIGLMFAVSPAFAQLTYTEVTDGDLSDSGPTPTGFILGVGTNTISGSLGPGGGGGATNGNDADIFTFTLGAGETINSISTTRTGAGTQSFVGYANSSSISAFNDNATLGAAVDSGSLFGNGFLNAAQAGGIPTTLGAGDHTFIFQETGGAVDYSVSFNVVSAVPEPSSAALLGGLALCGFMRRRRK